MDKNLKIAVVCGGFSTEREVSLRSGKAVYDSLCHKGYKNVNLFDLTKENVVELLKLEIDIVYLALHGKGGEDGSIQGLLDLAGIPYTGSNVATSAICMNKILTKRFLCSANFPTAQFVTICKEDIKNKKQLEETLIAKFGFPMVIKAPSQGSSIGVTIVKERDNLFNSIVQTFQYEDEVLVERFIEGVEVTLPILGNNELLILPEVEIETTNDFYDYEAKYVKGESQHIIPARISEGIRDNLRDLGQSIYKSIGCRGLSRIDFIIDKSGQPWAIEINTLPGMTETSLFPDAANKIGVSFGDLVEKILSLAWDLYST